MPQITDWLPPLAPCALSTPPCVSGFEFMPRIRAMAAVFVFGLAAQPQEPEKLIRFETTSDLIVVDVTVRDRDGKPIEGLKKEDFTLLEDGTPQQISVFEFQRLTRDPLPPAKLEASPASRPRV